MNRTKVAPMQPPVCQQLPVASPIAAFSLAVRRPVTEFGTPQYPAQRNNNNNMRYACGRPTAIWL